MRPKGRISGVTALVAVVLLLVPALAWLQYRWVGQVSEAERERMQRTLRIAASQFATDFDTELSRAVVGLQVEGAIARDENWTSYAQRYTACSTSLGTVHTWPTQGHSDDADFCSGSEPPKSPTWSAATTF